MHVPMGHTLTCGTSRTHTHSLRLWELGLRGTQGKFLHCVHTAHAEAGIFTQVIRLVVTVLFPRNPFQKNEESKNI